MSYSLQITLHARGKMLAPALEGPIDQAFVQSAQRYGVPVAILKAICHMEGRTTNHDGEPSIDGGYGCMHLVENEQANTLQMASQGVGVSQEQLKQDIVSNIQGGAFVLRQCALKQQSTLPTSLGDWYGTLAACSNATTQSTAQLYADEVYRVMNSGFSDQNGQETITLAPQVARPNIATSKTMHPLRATLPYGCRDDGRVEYPGAINCIVKASTFNCNKVKDGQPCTYESANRAKMHRISRLVIHDIEGTAQNALNVFLNPRSGVSIHYIVDSNGTVYQVLHEKDIAYHAGNYWYNQRSIGIEHAGYDATGFLWYNATEYLASAKLVAYLLKKYHIPLDHNRILAHGTVPATGVAYAPNHVDPGPYWLWDYYFGLINQQGIAYASCRCERRENIVTLHPESGQQPHGRNGKETATNFNFFILYKDASTDSARIPRAGSKTDVTDETDNVETNISYYYLDKVKDPAGSGMTLYQIWYGVQDQVRKVPRSNFAHAQLAWLAVPPGAAQEGIIEGRTIIVTLKKRDHSRYMVSGKPDSSATYHLGSAPGGATFVATTIVKEQGKNQMWYAINYNHRQAWIPTSSVASSQE